MKTINITKVRQELINTVEDTIITHKPIIILAKKGGAVKISTEDWKKIQETIYLTSIIRRYSFYFFEKSFAG